MSPWRRASVGVFLTLLGTYAYFWQSRDWNSASRLMLTYALVDRGTVAINGLQEQTGDRAAAGGWYYTDKLPGFSLLAALPYGAGRLFFRLPPHPLGGPALSHWPADYWVTVGTSGLLSALAGVWLVGLARDLGCRPRRATLVGLAYGLGTPAFAYATMSYGHQSAAFALLASFGLLLRRGRPREALRVGVAGALAAYASVIEIQVGPASAVLGVYLLFQVIRGQRKPSVLGDFAVGAALPTLLLLGYNQLAFGSPWEMGYFHHTTKIFADVHSAANPLGLRPPGWGRALDLLWGRYRGLLFYAPVVALAPFGLWTLARRGRGEVASVAGAVCLSIFGVNLAYDQWSGGWSTGPRLLVPLLPFAMIPVAGWLASARLSGIWVAALLGVAGGILTLGFVGVGGRLSQDFPDPLLDAVWPLWRGDPLPRFWPGTRFARNACSVVAGDRLSRLAPGWQWVQFAPLIVGQGVAIAWLFRAATSAPAARSDLGVVDKQQ